jgi:hypothetical protein
MKVTAISLIDHDGQRYEIGQELDLPEVDAETLVALGAAQYKAARRKPAEKTETEEIAKTEQPSTEE